MFNPEVRKIPWRREWQPTPIFLPGEFHGQRSLAGYSPWGYKESDTTGQRALSLSLDFLDQPVDNLAGDRARDRGLNGLFYIINISTSYRL